jgi:hypothetical protein
MPYQNTISQVALYSSYFSKIFSQNSDGGIKNDRQKRYS